MSDVAPINIDSPRHDQSTYSGRARHFFITTNPLNLLKSSAELSKAKDIVESYRRTQVIPPGLSVDGLWRAKHLYDSAYHPDTGEKMFILGRMSAQVPMNMTITGCMLTFYKTTPQVVLWQWLNQSFNAIVNYTNRSGDSAISTSQLGVSYVLATSAATGTALFLNRLVKSASPLVGRYVPFAAVAAANCLNIPFMRSRELTHGIPVFSEDGTRLGDSKTAAKLAIGQVLVSRIVMAMPSMCISPIIMNYLEKDEKSFLRRYPKMNAPFQVGVVGLFLLVATPMCCALFPQKSSISVSHLEDDLRKKIEELGKTEEKRVYFNKGL